MIRPTVHEREFEITRAIMIDASNSDAPLVIEQLRHALSQKRHRESEQETERKRDRKTRGPKKHEW